MLYLNLKVGPSYGGGFVPDDAPHEARERDYFFALAFWTWGAWAGLGAHALAVRIGRGSLGLLLAALPAALNWNAADRAREPGARLARAVAASLLESTPPRAVLLVNGDNDTYPLWYLQQAEGVRRDVVVVTIPLLGAPWYRGELVRRWALLDPVAQSRWEGEGATLRSIGRHARIESRPLAVSVAVPAETRASLSASPWSVRGMVFVEADENEDPRLAWVEDSTVTAAVAAALAPVVRRAPHPSPDGAPRVMFELLRCPSAALGGRGVVAGSEGASGLLDSACNLR